MVKKREKKLRIPRGTRLVRASAAENLEIESIMRLLPARGMYCVIRKDGSIISVILNKKIRGSSTTSTTVLIVFLVIANIYASRK